MKIKVEFNLDYIIEEYSNYIFKIVDNIVGSSLPYQDKEEIVADSFFLLWKNQDKINTNLKAYLSAIARNVTYEKFRKNCNYNSLENRENVSYTEEFDNIIILRDNLKNLSEEERKIFDMYYVQGLKIKEISAYLNITNSNVKIKLHRIRKKLKEAFNE